MPELPEVETVRRGLATLLPGHTVIAERHDWPKSFPSSSAEVQRALIGARVTQLRRRAKVLLIDLSSGYTLVIHLKMTGQLVFRGSHGRHFGAGHPSESLVGALPDRSTRVQLELDHGTLYFNDQRKFGWIKIVPTTEVPQLPFMQKVGPEPLDKNFTLALFTQRLQRRARSGVKAVLLDQTVLAGIGNIYADEALWAAKIHPETRVQDIPPAKLAALHKGLRAVLRLSIQKGGSTDRNYVDAHGRKGSYLGFAKVFRRQGQPCERCGTSILKLRVAGRGTHICPHCQKLPTTRGQR